MNKATEECFLGTWKQNIVIPLHKGKGDKRDTHDYCIIFIMPPLAKMYLRLVIYCMLEVASVWYLYTVRQSWFQKWYCLEDKVQFLMFAMQIARAMGCSVVVVVVNLEKA